MIDNSKSIALIIVGIFLILSTIYAGQRKQWNEKCPNISKYDNPKIGYDGMSYLIMLVSIIFIVVGVQYG